MIPADRSPNGPARDDIVLPFQVGDTAVRGRVVRLAGAVDDILRAHEFDDAVSELVGEAAALVAAMGAALKFDGKLIFQIHADDADAPASMAVADYQADGALRATATTNAPAAEGARGLAALVGEGRIVMTVDQGPDMERYQGVTPIEGDTLEAAAVAYFDRSEQIPTAVRLAVGRVERPGEPSRWRAGAVIAQHVPAEGGARERGEAALKSEADREAWERAAALLATTQADELLDPDVSPETLLYRLFHEDGARVFDAKPVRAACSCNATKIEAVLKRYAAEDLADMLEDGAIRVTCEFCRRAYAFDATGTAIDARPRTDVK